MPRISVITPSIRPEGLDVVRATLAAQTFTDFEWIPKLSIPGPIPDLCRAFNEAVRESKGELIVFLQDFIKIAPDGLERMWKFYQQYPRTGITAPVGQTMDWQSVEWDWRPHVESKELLQFYQWEIDWGAVAREEIVAVGGFDEDYDSGFGWENVDLAARMAKNGVTFRCDPGNLAVAFQHDKFIPHPFKHMPNRDLWAGKQRSIESGIIKLPFIGA